MHKFFCNYNPLTGKYEITQIRGFRNNVLIQAENKLFDEIKELLQQLYENIVFIKEKEEDEERLNKLDEIELMISNLYYSLFSSPLELAKEEHKENADLNNCIKIIDKLISHINLPEQSRLCLLIKNGLTSLKEN